MMVDNTQDYQVFELSPSSGILETKKTYHFGIWSVSALRWRVEDMDPSEMMDKVQKPSNPQR
jgi:hypothetical protein